MRDPAEAYIALGSNLGTPLDEVERALAALAALPRTAQLIASSLYRSAPVGAHGPDFVNAVARVETLLTAPDLLAELQRLEQLAGRTRPFPNAPRTLDLDLVFYGEALVDSPALVLPHPRWRERAFVLLPLAELAPQRVPPQLLEAVRAQQCSVIRAARVKGRGAGGPTRAAARPNGDDVHFRPLPQRGPILTFDMSPACTTDTAARPARPGARVTGVGGGRAARTIAPGSGHTRS